MSSLAAIRPVTIRGSCVRLEPMDLAHDEELYAVGTDERMWTYLARPPLISVGDARSFIQEALDARARGSALPFVIRVNTTDRLIGSTRYLDIEPVHGSVEIGWTFVHPEHWGTKAGIEAQFLLAWHAFENLDAQRVWFKTDARNARARRALERCGIVREGVLRRHLRVRDGFLRDSVVHAIIAEEWPGIRERGELLLWRSSSGDGRPVVAGQWCGR